MRIVNHQDMMKLPEGTLFTAIEQPWVMGGMYIKGETCVWDGKNGDFYQRDLCWVDANDSGEAVNRLEEMLLKGASYPVDTAYGREGLFDDNQLYMVYDRDDVRSILNDLRDVLHVQ